MSPQCVPRILTLSQLGVWERGEGQRVPRLGVTMPVALMTAPHDVSMRYRCASPEETKPDVARFVHNHRKKPRQYHVLRRSYPGPLDR